MLFIYIYIYGRYIKENTCINLNSVGQVQEASREAASEQIAVKSSYKESSFAWPNEWMKDCAFTVWLYDGYVHWETLACQAKRHAGFLSANAFDRTSSKERR